MVNRDFGNSAALRFAIFSIVILVGRDKFGNQL